MADNTTENSAPKADEALAEPAPPEQQNQEPAPTTTTTAKTEDDFVDMRFEFSTTNLFASLVKRFGYLNIEKTAEEPKNAIT